MIEPDDISIGNPVTLDGGPPTGRPGFVVEVARQAPDSWIVSHFPIASGTATARIKRTHDVRSPWFVEVFDPMIDGEECEDWRDALTFAMALPPRVP
jgi:hypothetical protein